MERETTLEWFGATTFRLCSRGITIFLDTWLERPSTLPKYLAIEDVTEADYIFISHAHFDHLPGADRLAIKTGAIVIANCEAINVLQNAGVPEEQLLRVAGGERIPLFTRDMRTKARRREIPTAPSLLGQPLNPDCSLAVMSVHVWPSLHAFIPNPHPDIMDTGVVYTGESSPYVCTVDITRGMKYGLLKLGKIMPPENINESIRSFIEYVEDRDRNLFSHCDGGQLMFNILIDGKAILWSAHLGAYKGIIECVEPKPEVAILGIAGRANLNGRPFDGSAAQFALMQVKWLGQPKNIIWCLHDDSCVPPYKVETSAATEAVETKSNSKILSLVPSEITQLEI